MKKNISTLILLILITPSMALASWWNPFSWFHFSKIEKTETIQIATSTVLSIATTSTSTAIAPITKIDNKKESVKNIAPQPSHQTCQGGFIWDEQKSICAITSTATNAQKCEYYYGINSIWDGALNNNGSPICVCRTGWMMNEEKTICVLKPVPATPQKTDDQICVEKFGKNYKYLGDKTCGCKDGYTKNNGACVTYDKACDATFSNASLFKIDDDGELVCNCDDGYVWNSNRTACQRQQQNYNNSDPYDVSSGSGNAYSPEQLNGIDCAYYGTNCYAPAPVQIYNTYQYTPPVTQTQTVNCANYQIEKANLDQQAANSGTLFSSGRVEKENALKARYPGCY